MHKQVDQSLYTSLSRVYGSLTNRVLDKIHTPPSRLYVRVNTLRTDRDDLLKLLDRHGYSAHPDPYVHEAIYFEITGPYNVPVLDKKIYVDKYTAENVMIGSDLYAPGVVKYSYFEKGDLVNIVAPDNRIIAVVETVVSSNMMFKMKRGLVGVNKISLYRAPSLHMLPGFNEGLFYTQSLPAMMVSRLLDPRHYELIVDMNSAPGGKTSHVAMLANNKARIIAFERNLRKTLVVRDTLNRLGLFRNVILLPMDSRYIDLYLALENRVDKVIVDPPCSGLGVRPKISIDVDYRDIVVLRNYQIQFLKTAYRIVKKNGLIVYSTCTITYDENEYVTKQFIDNYSVETVDYNELPYSEKILLDDIVAYRYSPIHHDMPGYYIVVFRKKS